MFIESSAILGASPSRQRIEQFHEARLVRITRGGFAILLDPFGMLDPQVVVNLFPELGVGMNLVKHEIGCGKRFMCGGEHFLQSLGGMIDQRCRRERAPTAI